MKYGIGLDIGIASVGFAVLALDAEEEPCGIVRLGSRIFDAAEVPKNGASLALPRREARSARRRLRRRRHRLERIRHLFIQSELLTADELKYLFSGVLGDIYELRVRSLDERVSDKELARILVHLAQRRGFKSNRKSEAKDKEGGKLLQAVKVNQEAMESQGFRTVGEMFYKDERFAESKRNKGGAYLTVVHRDMIIFEAERIIEAQRRLGNEKLTEAFQEKYLEILKSQRQFDEGPGYPSPAAGNQIEKMIGFCTFESGEKRAAKACYSFEYFNLLQKINHIRLSEWDGSVRGLTAEERQKLTKLCKTKENVDFLQIRDELTLGENTAFNIRYEDGKDPRETEKKTKFCFLKFYHQMRKALNGVKKNRINDYAPEILDEIGRILTIFKGDDSRREKLAGLNIAGEDIEALLEIGSVSKFSNLSLKALRNITPYLKEGLSYDKACEAAGYNFRAHGKGEKSFLLPAQAPETEDIANPVVRRAIAQTIKVVNAIIREQEQSPLYINIELARELSKTFEERMDIDKENKENRAKNDQLVKELKETFGLENPTGSDILKLKLYYEQQGICLYSGRSFDLHRLFEHGYAEIDHIVPHSISFDDSYNNKALVLASANQNKGDRLPWQYIHDDLGIVAANEYEVRVNNNIRDSRKRQRLLKKQLTDEDIDGFKERNLQDTKYLSRFILNYINDYLQFALSERGRVKRVTAVKGAVTAYLRKRWGINKNRSNGDKHHAVDAAVIACTTDSLIQKVSYWNKKQEREGCDGVKADKRFPAPWQHFRKELEIRAWGNESDFASLSELNPYYYGDIDIAQIRPIFVSRMPRRKVTGPAHMETVKGVKASEPGLLICKRDIKKLKLDADGEIADYYNRESDRLLYEALKARLQAFGGNGEKAFAEPFYKPKADGSRGPLVKKVKVCEKSTLNVSVQQNTAAADNGSMVRVDVFRITEGKDKGYYLVPVYVADTIKAKLPNKAIVAAKPYEEWKEMDDKDFVFSLYPNDLIKISHTKSIKFKKTDKDSTWSDSYETMEFMGYYKKTDISGGSTMIITHDNSYFARPGMKTLDSIEKYQVDVLGNYHKVNRELRRTFSIKRKR